MTRKEQKMAKALHQISALDVTIGQLMDMLESEGEEVNANLERARWSLGNTTGNLYDVIRATGLHQALCH